MMPVRPPNVNIEMNPRAHIMGMSIIILKFDNVASQLNTLIPVGIAMIMVAAVK